MKIFKVLQNGIETNSWKETQEMDENYWEPSFGPPGTYQLVIEDIPDYEEQLKWKEFRQLRNSILTACDWTQLVDAPLDITQKQEYREYRSYLRDLPQNIPDLEALELTTIMTFEEWKNV